jgi:hypothetical protein
MEVNVTCSCGRLHQYLPEDTQLVDGIYWFNCICGSTRTFMPELTLRRLDGKIREDRKKRAKEEIARQNEWVKREYKLKVKPEIADKNIKGDN